MGCLGRRKRREEITETNRSFRTLGLIVKTTARHAAVPDSHHESRLGNRKLAKPLVSGGAQERRGRSSRVSFEPMAGYIGLRDDKKSSPK